MACSLRFLRQVATMWHGHMARRTASLHHLGQKGHVSIADYNIRITSTKSVTCSNSVSLSQMTSGQVTIIRVICLEICQVTIRIRPNDCEPSDQSPPCVSSSFA